MFLLDENFKSKTSFFRAVKSPAEVAVFQTKISQAIDAIK